MRTAIGASAAAIAGCAVAAGQCPPQWDGLGLALAGADNVVWGSVAWDPDGPGPQGSMLVLAGGFRTIANLVTGHGLVAWDGQSWRELPDPGFTGFFTGSLAVHQGKLVAAGRGPAGPVVSAYDGTSWTVLGTGPNAGESAWAVAVYNGELYAAGFTSFAGVSGRVARLTAQGWVGLPTPFPAMPTAMTVVGGTLAIGGSGALGFWDGAALTVHESGILPYSMIAHQNELYAGTYAFHGNPVGRWSGAQWEFAGTGIGPSFQHAYAFWLGSYGGDLYASGDFVIQGPPWGAQLARLSNGVWGHVGGRAVFGPLTEMNGKLYCLASGWDGAQWEDAWPAPNLSGEVSWIGEIDGQPCIAGGFQMTDSAGAAGHGLARRQGDQWAVETGVPLVSPRCAIEFGGALYVGGAAFMQASLYRRTGSTWEPLDFDSSLAGVGSLVEWNGLLVAGGWWYRNNTYVSVESSPDGQAWTQMSPPGEVLGLIIHQGQLHAYGRPYSGSASVVWRYENDHWVQMGGTFNARVQSVSTFEGALLAGGSFTSVGGVAAERLARWSGTAWEPIAPGVPGMVTVVRQHGSRLIVGGWVPTSGPTHTMLRAWDGSAWASLAAPVAGVVSDVRSRPDGLWVGGSFTALGGAVAPGVARLRTFPCYANCDCSPTPPLLNVGDFSCFLQRYSAGDAYANCDASTTPPVLNVADFGCFLMEYARGCP
ncbi:MAG: hypothetical protein WD749_05435 [Phycisphaerales bacterium]